MIYSLLQVIQIIVGLDALLKKYEVKMYGWSYMCCDNLGVQSLNGGKIGILT